MIGISDIRNAMATTSFSTIVESDGKSKQVQNEQQLVVEKGKLKAYDKSAVTIEGGVVTSLASRHIEPGGKANVHLLTREEFLSALKSGGAVGKLVAERLESGDYKRLSDREFFRQGIAEYDQMSGLLGRKAGAIKEKELAQLFPKQLLKVLPPAVKQQFEALMLAAKPVGQVEKYVANTFNAKAKEDLGDVHLEALASCSEENSKFAEVAREFINGSSGWLELVTDEGVRAQVEEVFERLDELVERAESRALAMDNISYDFAAMQKLSRENERRLSVANVVRPVVGLESEQPEINAQEAESIQDFKSGLKSVGELIGVLEKKSDELEMGAGEFLSKINGTQEKLDALQRSMDVAMQQLQIVGSRSNKVFTASYDHRKSNHLQQLYPMLNALSQRLERLRKVVNTVNSNGLVDRRMVANAAFNQNLNRIVTQSHFEMKTLKRLIDNEHLKELQELEGAFNGLKGLIYPDGQAQLKFARAANKVIGLLAAKVSKQPANGKADSKEQVQLAAIKKVRNFIEDLPALDENLLRAALRGDIDLENLIQLKMQGAQDGMILQDELLARGTSPQERASTSDGGKGSFNEVTVTDFKDGLAGRTNSYVFKPVENANDGLDRAKAATTIYGMHVSKMKPSEQPKIIANNICARKGAEAIGCGSVITNSGLTFVHKDGEEFGSYMLAMEKAPGNTLSNMLHATKGGVNVYDSRIRQQGEQPITELTFKDALARMTEEDRQRIMDDLMFQCNDLEWADFLSGQADRHFSNIMVGAEMSIYHQVDPETRQSTEVRHMVGVTVKGIDNDISFPMVETQPCEPGDSARLEEAFKGGVLSARLPTFITQSMYDKLQAYSKEPEKFLKSMNVELLRPQQVAMLRKRLDQMVAHAKKLKDDQFLIPDDPETNRPVLTAEMRGRIETKMRASQVAFDVMVSEDEAKDFIARHAKAVKQPLKPDLDSLHVEKPQTGGKQKPAQEEIDKTVRDLTERRGRSVAPIFASIAGWVGLPPKQ